MESAIVNVTRMIKRFAVVNPAIQFNLQTQNLETSCDLRIPATNSSFSTFKYLFADQSLAKAYDFNRDCKLFDGKGKQPRNLVSSESNELILTFAGFICNHRNATQVEPSFNGSDSFTSIWSTSIITRLRQC